MEERLSRKGVPPDVIASTTQYLKDCGLLDDRSLAETLKREAFINRLLSQAGARNFVLRRGISKNIVDAIFVDSENTDRENAEKFAEKRLRVIGKYPPATVKRRLYHQLSRRGYSTETIMKILKEKIEKEEP